MISIVNFKVSGSTPILMNNPSSMDEKSGPGGTTRTKKYPPEHEANIRIYANAEGFFYVPSIAFLNSLWGGAAYEKIGKDSARARIQSSVFVAEEETLLLKSSTGEPIRNYDEIDSRYVVVQKARIMRCRPLIKDWMCILSLEVDSDYISAEDNIIPLFNKAGRVTGVMDYRPSTRGPFGRYTVELYSGNGDQNEVRRRKK